MVLDKSSCDQEKLEVKIWGSNNSKLVKVPTEVDFCAVLEVNFYNGEMTTWGEKRQIKSQVGDVNIECLYP